MTSVEVSPDRCRFLKSRRKKNPCTRRLVTRKKVMVIPYIIQNNTRKYVLVKDYKTGEWGFISGGIKSNETSYEAAERELKEETSNTLHIPNQYMRVFDFVTLYRPSSLKLIDIQRNEIVRSLYTVFEFEITNDDIKHMLQTFKANKEVVNISCNVYESFMSCNGGEGTWVFCDQVYNTYMNESIINT